MKKTNEKKFKVYQSGFLYGYDDARGGLTFRMHTFKTNSLYITGYQHGFRSFRLSDKEASK